MPRLQPSSALLGTLQLARATPDRVASDAILDAGIRSALVLAQ